MKWGCFLKRQVLGCITSVLTIMHILINPFNLHMAHIHPVPACSCLPKYFVNITISSFSTSPGHCIPAFHTNHSLKITCFAILLSHLNQFPLAFDISTVEKTDSTLFMPVIIFNIYISSPLSLQCRE